MPLRRRLLATNSAESVAVDLESGSLRRIAWYGEIPTFDTYDVVEATSVIDVDSPFPGDTLGASNPVVVGRMRGPGSGALARSATRQRRKGVGIARALDCMGARRMRLWA